MQGEFWRITDASQLTLLLSHLRQQSLPFRLQIVPDGRTLPQNDMHAGLCRDIAKALKDRTGLDYDVDYMRAKTKRLFGVTATQPDPATGKDEPYLLSTTKYSKAQMSKLIDGTLAWAQSDLGIALPDPRMGRAA